MATLSTTYLNHSLLSYLPTSLPPIFPFCVRPAPSHHSGHANHSTPPQLQPQNEIGPLKVNFHWLLLKRAVPIDLKPIL